MATSITERDHAVAETEIVNGLPEGWRWASLEDIVENPRSDIVDGPFGSNLKASEYKDDGVPIIRIQNVARNKFNERNVRFVSHQKAKELKRHSFQPGDIVITKLGDPVGKTCIVPDNFGPGVIVADIVRLRLNPAFLSIPYIAYSINSSQAAEQIAEHVKGTTRPRVNLNHVRELMIPLAPLGEQKRIVAKLEELLPRANAVRERLIMIKAIMKRFRQSALSAACSGRLTEDWRGKNLEIETASDLLERIKKRRRGGDSRELNISAFPGDNLPESWVECNLGSLSELITKGSSPNWQGMNYAETGTLFVTSENVGLGDLVLKNRKYVEERFNKIQKRSILKRGDLLTNIVGASIGRSAIFDLDEEANINQAVALIRLESEVDKKYILNVLKSPLSIDLMHRTKVDVARANLSLSDVTNLPVPLPPISEQKEIVLRVDSLFNLADSIEKVVEAELSRTEKMTQAILAKAFRGELVPTEAKLGRQEARVGV